MADEPDTLRARLERLAALVELARQSRSEEDRARMERTIQLVSWALQAVARARQWSDDAACQSEAAEVEALCRRIVQEARAAGLRIGDNDNWG
jgi:imidazolonepropionase-like amidohydrolase